MIIGDFEHLCILRRSNTSLLDVKGVPMVLVSGSVAGCLSVGPGSVSGLPSQVAFTFKWSWDGGVKVLIDGKSRTFSAEAGFLGSMPFSVTLSHVSPGHVRT